MKKIKTFLCLAMAMALLWHSGSQIYAAAHVVGCGTTAEKVTCGAYFNNVFLYTHELYKTSAGRPVNCTVRAEKHYHTIRCANKECNVILNNKHVRTCVNRHTYCPHETGLCQ